jgi:hypothetical protein
LQFGAFRRRRFTCRYLGFVHRLFCCAVLLDQGGNGSVSGSRLQCQQKWRACQTSRDPGWAKRYDGRLVPRHFARACGRLFLSFVLDRSGAHDAPLADGA